MEKSHEVPNRKNVNLGKSRQSGCRVQGLEKGMLARLFLESSNLVGFCLRPFRTDQ
jgi:hypothetical protein